MNADPDRTTLLLKELLHPLKDRWNLMRQSAAVSVAKGQRLGSSLDRLPQRGETIFPVVLKAIEEMFGIIDQVLNMRPQKSQRILNDEQIVLQSDAQGIMDMNIPALAEDGHCRSLRRQ